MKTATYLTLPLAAGKRYIRRDGSITPPLTGGPIWLEDLETKFIFEPNHPFVFDPSGSDLSDKDLVADYHETRDGRPVRILATDVKHPAHHPDQGAPMTCEAQKRGYVPVRVTQDVNGWPVGFEGWLDPTTRDNRVWDADCTDYWFHTPGASCERITPTMDLSNIKIGDKVRLRDGSVDTIIDITPERIYSIRSETNRWTAQGQYHTHDKDHDLDIIEILPADEPYPVGSVHTTRDGSKATIISTNLTSSPDEMLVLVSSDDGDDYTLLYKETGRYFDSDDLPYPYDLIPPQTTITLTVPAHRVAELEAFANALR